MLPPSLARPTAAGLNIPPPSLDNQTPTALFQPYEDPDHDLGDEGDVPSCESPSGHPLWLNFATRPMEVQDSEARRPRRLFKLAHL